MTGALEKHLYADAHYDLTVAGNGLHAFQKIKAGKHVDLMVFSMSMPGMTGLELLKKTRLDLRLGIPALIIANPKDKARLQIAAKLQISGLILQPCEVEKALGQIKAILKPEDDMAKASVTSEIFLDRLNQESEDSEKNKAA